VLFLIFYKGVSISWAQHHILINLSLTRCLCFCLSVSLYLDFEYRISNNRPILGVSLFYAQR